METPIRDTRTLMPAILRWILIALIPGGAIAGAIYGPVSIYLSAGPSDAASTPGLAFFGGIFGLAYGTFLGLCGAAGGFGFHLRGARNRRLVTALGAALGVALAWGLIIGLSAQATKTSGDATTLVTATVSTAATALVVGVLPYCIRQRRQTLRTPDREDKLTPPHSLRCRFLRCLRHPVTLHSRRFAPHRGRPAVLGAGTASADSTLQAGPPPTRSYPELGPPTPPQVFRR